MSVEIKIDLDRPVQENFLGNNAVLHGYAGMPDKYGRVYSEELCELEADRAMDLGVKIVRTFYKWYAWDEKTDTWDWNNVESTVFNNWLARMKKRNIQVALNTGWCFPGDVFELGGWNGKSPFKVEGDWNASVKNYAKWVSETIHQLVEVRGFTNIKYILLFVECQIPTQFNYVVDNKHIFELWRDCAKAVCEQLVLDGRRHLVKIVGPNEGSTESSVMCKWLAENCDQYIDIYSSHNYQDFILNEVNEAENTNALVLTVAGSRVQQEVALKPDTDYTLQVELALDTKDPVDISGSIIIGAWDTEKLGDNSLILSGGQPTGRLNRGSTTLIDPASLKDGKNKVNFTFNSGNKDKCVIGIFSDLKAKNDYLKLYFCSLCEKGSESNILANPDFTKCVFGRDIFHSADPIEFIPKTWRYVICVKEETTIDPYYHLYSSARTLISNVPKNKPVWFDEYNVRSEVGAYHIPAHGTHLVAAMQSLMNAGVQTSIMWTIFDQQWPNNLTNNNDGFVDGDHRYGIMPVLTRSLIPHPAYYATALAFKYMGGEEGTKIFSGEGKNLLHATLSEMPDGNISLLVVNNKLAPDNFTVNFSKNLGVTFKRYLYNPKTIVPDETATLISADKTFYVSDFISDSLPGKSVAVYTTV